MTGEPLHIITIGSVAAITSDLRAVPAVSPQALARYDSTLRALAEILPALLPARFGTFTDLEELRQVLRSRQAAIRQALAHVRNRTQMTLRIIEAGGAGAASEASRGKLSSLRAVPAPDGTSYLRARAAAIRGPEIAGFEPVRLAVTRWIRDERRERRGKVATVYHLVPRRSSEAYRRAVQRVGWKAGLNVTVTGPFPPYAFAEI